MDSRHSDANLIRALGALGTEHDPDVAAIRRRMDDGSTHQVPTGPRGRPAVWLAAAAVIVAVGVPAWAAGMFTPSSTVTIEAARPASPRSSTAPSAGSAPSGSADDPALVTASHHLSAGPKPAPAIGGSTRTVGPGRPNSPGGAASLPTADTAAPPANPGPPPANPDLPTAAPTVAGPDIRVDTTPASQVNLSAPPLVDWVAVGARADLKQVRAKSASGSPLLVVDQPASATSVAGPFALSWSGGLPEQTHTNATRWLSNDPTAGLSVIVAPSDHVRTLVLYCGTRDLNGTVTTQTNGAVTARAAVISGSGASATVRVSIQLPATSAPTRVLLSGSASGPQPAVYLGAASLSDG